MSMSNRSGDIRIFRSMSDCFEYMCIALGPSEHFEYSIEGAEAVSAICRLNLVVKACTRSRCWRESDRIRKDPAKSLMIESSPTTCSECALNSRCGIIKLTVVFAVQTVAVGLLL